MSDEDEESISETTSDEEYDQTQTDANLFPPTQPVHQNQVLELVHHNHKLQTTLRTSTANLQIINRDVSSFYYRLRDSCKKLQKAYEQSQRTITQLQVDKYNLSRRLLEPDLQSLALDPKGSDSDKGDAVFNDTVNSLQRQLRICERDKRQVIQSHQTERAQWQSHYATLEETWNAREEQWRQYANTLREDYDSRAYQAQLEHYKEIVEHDKLRDTLKSQTTMLLQDAEKQKEVLSKTEKSLKALQSQLQDKELRILNMSEEIETKEKALWNKDDQVLSLRQDLEKCMAKRKEKEKSLEEIIQLYSDLERKYTQQLETVKNYSEERDKIYGQYLCADESLKKKADEITELKRKLEEAETRDNVSVFQAQVEIFRNDFRMEREARQNLHKEYDKLRVDHERNRNLIGQYEIEMQRMKQELMRCHDMMRNRNGIP